MNEAINDGLYSSGPGMGVGSVAGGVAEGSSRRDGVPYRPRHGLVAWLMQRTERDLTSMLDRELRPTGLTFSQFGVLQALVELEPTSSAQVARAMLVSPQAMVGLVATLERKNYIRRRTGVAAGRTLETTVTPAGQRAYERAAAIVARVDDVVAATCGDLGADGFAGVMDQLTAAAARTMRDGNGNGD